MLETKKILENLNKIELTEMARIGFTEKRFEVYVNTDDGGNTPHFHYRKGKYPKFKNHTCIEIKQAKYFHHDGKEATLDSKQRKDLVKFLQAEDEYEKGKTHWQILLKEWNRNNSKMKVEENQVMPNYLDLN